LNLNIIEFVKEINLLNDKEERNSVTELIWIPWWISDNDQSI